MLNPQPIETAPIGKEVLIYLPHLDSSRPESKMYLRKHRKIHTGWYRAILRHFRNSPNQPLRWKCWLYKSTTAYLSVNPLYWTDIENV